MLLLGKLNPCTRLLWRPVQIPMMRSVTTGTPSLKLKKESEMTFSPVNPPDKYLEASRNQNKYLKMLLAEKGKTKFSENLMVAAIVSTFLVLLSPFVVFKKKIIEFYLHPETMIVKQPPKTMEDLSKVITYHFSDANKKLLNQVLDDLKVPEKLRENVTTFTSDTFDAYGIGVIWQRLTLSLGVPFYTEYTSASEIEPSLVRHKPYISPFQSCISLGDIQSDENNKKEVEELKETFILSENGKKFLMAQKIAEAQSLTNFWSKIITLPVMVLLVGLTVAQINDKLGLFKKPYFFRLGMYALIYSSAGVGYLVGMASDRADMEDYVDRRLYSLSPDYLEGGIEYYSKSIQRGQLFLKLHPKGKVYFDRDGNVEKSRFKLINNEFFSAKPKLQKATDFKNGKINLEFGKSLIDKIKMY